VPHPRPGVDYPESWSELLDWFPDEAACLAYLERLRWPAGFLCPGCEGEHGWRMGDGLYRCAACDRRTSATAGTIFAGTRSPLTLWFAAAWYITNQKSGVSALGLQRALALGSYETAWAWLHKFRRAMVRPSRDRLSGEIEVDESYLGGVAPGKPGRGAEKKAVVAIAVEKRGRGMGRIRLARIPDTSADSLLPVIKEVVELGSVVSTDGHLGYKPLAAAGYTHDRRSIQASGRLPTLPRRVSSRHAADASPRHTRNAAPTRANRPAQPTRSVALPALRGASNADVEPRDSASSSQITRPCNGCGGAASCVTC
jgi:transposase-like protein